jgi:hypothetical protein
LPSRSVPRPPASRLTRPCARLLLCALAAAACGRSPSGPAEPRIELQVYGDAVIYAAAGAAAADPLRVFASDAGTRLPVSGVNVEWQLVEGAGSLSSSASVTDGHGVAATRLQAAQPGVYRVRASTSRLTGTAPTLEVRVVVPPTITGIEPAVAQAGGEIVVTGTNFSADALHNAVYFDGMRGRVLQATTTSLRVEVPSCLPDRQVAVVAGLGAVLSAPRALAASGGAGATLALAPGEARLLSAAADLGCVRLPGGQAGASYLLALHSAAQKMRPPHDFELRALTPFATAAQPLILTPPVAEPYSERWEAQLRRHERTLDEGTAAAATPPLAKSLRAQALPAPGDRREFNVLNASFSFDRVTAVVRAVSERAVIFVDTEAHDAFSESDIRYFADLFDDPIYNTTTAVFGAPSDIDGNGRIFILFTPRVNALTPRTESSFVTGFFYACDLLEKKRCAGSNEAELFYSMVPDPAARWSGARPHATVREAVPPIMAHELQHMINFARRGSSIDALWLAEALAHTAEELVGDVLTARGEHALGRTFSAANLVRAQRYLASPAAATVVAEIGIGAVEMRGAVWLLLKHLRGHHGGDDLLRRLTASNRTGAANVVHETGTPWATLLADFGVALWADGAPEVTAPLAPRHRFVGFNLRAALAAVPGGYPLRPVSLAWRDFAVTGPLGAGSHALFLLAAPADGTGVPLNFVVAGARGATLQPDTELLLTVLRVR